MLFQLGSSYYVSWAMHSTVLKNKGKSLVNSLNGFFYIAVQLSKNSPLMLLNLLNKRLTKEIPGNESSKAPTH